MRITTQSPYWEVPSLQPTVDPQSFRITKVTPDKQHYLLIEVDHQILVEGRIETRPLTLCFACADDNSCYKWSPVFAHIIKRDTFGFIGIGGCAYYFTKDRLKPFNITIAQSFLTKLNRDWKYSDNQLVTPFVNPRASQLS